MWLHPLKILDEYRKLHPTEMSHVYHTICAISYFTSNCYKPHHTQLLHLLLKRLFFKEMIKIRKAFLYFPTYLPFLAFFIHLYGSGFVLIAVFFLQRTSFNISCNSGLLKINSLCFYLSKNHLYVVLIFEGYFHLTEP